MAEFKCWIRVVNPEWVIEGRTWPDGCEKEASVFEVRAKFDS